MESITLEWRRFEDLSAAELYALLRFRQSIFVVEQCSPYADLDGRDCGARHLVAVAGGEPVGYLRVVPAAEAIQIGRVAVAPSRRRRGLGSVIRAGGSPSAPSSVSGTSMQASASPRFPPPMTIAASPISTWS
jgi:predicted GNAT family N-acyltransferase